MSFQCQSTQRDRVKGGNASVCFFFLKQDNLDAVTRANCTRKERGPRILNRGFRPILRRLYANILVEDLKIYRARGAHPNSASAHVLIGAQRGPSDREGPSPFHRYRSLSHNTVFPSQRFKDHDPGGESLHCRCQGGTNALVPVHPRSSSFAS